MILYHFTDLAACQALGPDCVLVPRRWEWVWMTSCPDPGGTGLSGGWLVLLGLARTQARYRITDTSTCRPWPGSAERARLPRSIVAALEDDGADPGTWWISAVPVPAVLDQSYV